jgi:secreted trypsin-like serine protease
VVLLESSEENLALTTGQMLWVTGWGATNEGGLVVSRLNELSIPYVARETCNDPLSYNGQITESMICAGKAGRDSCQGDSGGPLIIKRNGSAQLVGIVSWGEGCARPGKFGVYTRVPKFVSWIRSCTASPDTCQ